MSQRGKRPNCTPVDGPSPTKRRKGRPPTISIDAEEFTSPSNGSAHHSSTSTVWQARPHLDLKMSSIYNRSAPEAPAELFRKDLISAMKLPDSEPLSHEEYWVITDQWKQEWERGVQVPVNPDSLPEPSVRLISENHYKARQDFKLPKNKYIRITKDENFSHDKHYLSNTPAIADSVCSYDLDQLDEAWLKEFNGERSMCGLPQVNEEQFERIIEELETRCHDKIQAIMKSEDGLGIEYDENVICDVCRSPDSEEANEMVFCDNCNICVHQACYGITTIPSGQWLCRTCSMGQKPDCVLCPNKGGAMKSTRSGQKWAHVSCALWIPEVSIGSVDRMEPITKISSIPQSRWALVCVLCRERVGACIQCSVKTCKTAYHVTCAFQHGLEMRAIIEDENAEDGVKLRSYCQKHSVKKEPKNSANSEKASASEDEEKACNNNITTNKKKLRKEMTSEERNHARLARLIEIQSEFDKHVSVKDISCHLLDVDQEGINHIYNFWILKRKAAGNEPLLLPKAGDVDVMSQTDQEQADIEKMKMFVHLRQDLERVRNLCYMVSRREKLSRSFFKMREQIFHKQLSVLSSHKKNTKGDDDALKAVLEANHGPSIYDVLYSSDSVRESRVLRIDEMIDSILGNNVSVTKSNKTLLEINGNIKREKVDAATRYSNIFNGATIASSRKYSSYDSLSSESDEMLTKRSRRKSNITATTSASSSEDEVQKSPTKSKILSSPITPQSIPSTQPKKKGRPPGSTKQATAEKRRLLNSLHSKEKLSKALNVNSSSEDDVTKHLPQSKVKSPLSTRNRLLNEDNQHLTDESDDLVPIKNSSGHSIPTQGGTIKRMQSSAIYSDSDSSSTDKDNRTDHTVSDSQQQPFRTKAAMKEFNENEVLPFNKLKKLPEISESKKNAMSIKKQPAFQTSSQSKKQTDLPPPPLRKDSSSSPLKLSPSKSLLAVTKSKKVQAKPPSNLSSDSENDESKKATKIKDITTKDKDKKSNSLPKKEGTGDFLVVPQREAAKKASENLMKTNSNLMVQSISGTASEKYKRDIKEKLDETSAALKALENEKEKLRESKESKSKHHKVLPLKEKAKTSSKEESKKIQKDDKSNDKEQKIREKEEKVVSDFPSEFLPYVPQRQAAKKAAEHIKGIGNSQPSSSSIAEQKSKIITPAITKKQMPDRRKSLVVDLSSSSSSTSSGSNSDSSSGSESASHKQPVKNSSVKTTKTTPSRRASTATGLKQKTRDLPFLDKAAKSSVNVETSSSSSYESDSSSDRVNTSRLLEKGNKNKRKSSELPSTKKVSSSPPKKPISSNKKENDKTIPTRRMSTVSKSTQPNAASASKPTVSTSISNRSTQKSVSEQTKSTENSASSRKRSTSVATPPLKISSNNKSRTPESCKRDLAKLPDKGKISADLKNLDSSLTNIQKTDNEILKKRRSSVLSPSKSLKEANKDDKSVEIKESNNAKTTESTSASTSVDESLIILPKEISEIINEKAPTLEEDQEKIDSSKVKKDKETITNDKTVKSDIQILDKSEDSISSHKKPKKDSFTVQNKINDDVDNSEVKMDIDETILTDHIDSLSTINQDKKNAISPKVNVPMTSPMISIPTANLNHMQEKNFNESHDSFKSIQLDRENIFNKPSTQNMLFETSKNLNIEDTERETYTLIEKLRQKNKKSSNPPFIADNNNITSEKINEANAKPSMLQNENTLKRDSSEQTQQQPLPNLLKNIDSSSRKDAEFNELKKSSWHQQQQQQQQQSHSIVENTTHFQRNILTSSCNKLNANQNTTLDPPPAPPPSCMVIEQQQKQLAACQKIGEENNMLPTSRPPMFVPPMGMMNLNDQSSHHRMEAVFNMHLQQQQQQQQQQQHQQKWQKDSKSSLNLKMMQTQHQQQNERLQSNLIKNSNSEMENMMNNMNQQALKNYAALHKTSIPNDFSSSLQHPHSTSQGANFNAYNFSDSTSQYPGAVSLFPPDLNVQVPFPSPGQAMFPPNFNNTFTSSQHQNNDHSLIMQNSGAAHVKINNNEVSTNIHFSNQNICSGTHFNQQHASNDIQMIQNIQPSSSDCNLIQANTSNEIIKKSPSKSTRSSPRNTTPTHAGGKTPQKSPSKSPRQPSTPASIESLSRQNLQKGKITPTANEGKQRKSRTNSQASPATTPADHRGNKGRGRSNNKNSNRRFPQNAMQFIPFNNETDYMAINKKLVGTVYDFSADEEFATNPSVENLRAMRDRRKSVDLYNKINKDGSSQSPKFTKNSMKPTTPLTHPLALNNHTMPNTVVNESDSSIPVTPSIPNLNLVNMPGPVDMRTYNSFDNTNDSYNSQLLGAFATNTVDQTLNDIDEEQEKELQIALKASNDKQKTPTTNTTSVIETSLTEISSIVEESVDSEASFAKVSLSDSRNQLKLKIKGPLAHHHDVQSQSIAHTQIAPPASSGASSNRRQMRKKELLQQYWNQGMNIDQEPSSIVANDQQAPSNILSNRVGGIPKAVDSMGLSLLKDEFQDFNYAEYKKRKRFALRGVDSYAEIDDLNAISNPINEVDPLAIDTNNKKRSRRPNRIIQQNINTNAPPKLKIKIGSDIMETIGSDLPPKKRLIAQPPSYQDLKRESMNFRKQMMEEFSEQKKSKEHRSKSVKRDRKEKKKRKKEKKRSVEIVSHPIGEGAPVKLILKISNKTTGIANTNLTSTPETCNLPRQNKLAATPPPIKLKLSRNSHGNGEYNILNASSGSIGEKQKTDNSLSSNNLNLTSCNNTTNNNNLQPPVIDASDINMITTKKLEVALERIDDIEKVKSDLANKQNSDAIKDDILSQSSNNCEVR